MPNQCQRRRAGQFGAGLLALFVVACGKSDSDAPPQAVAHVADAYVTRLELDRELNFLPAATGADAVRSKVALREIVARKYLAQKARSALLDNDPSIVVDLTRARDEILAAAYVQRELRDKAAAISAAEIDRYIAQHPRQFEKRVVFVVDQIQVPISGDVSAYIAMTREVKSLDDVASRLDAMRVGYARSKAEMDGGELSDAFFSALQGQTPDSVFFGRRDPQGVFFRVLSVDQRPIVGDEARAKARQALQVELLQKITEANASAAIAAATFLGDYAQTMKEPAAGAQSPTPAPSTKQE